MSEFNWNKLQSKTFNISAIENKRNADKLFVSLLIEIERRGINSNRQFTIKKLVDLIPKGTASVANHSTYGFSIMSMFSSQKTEIILFLKI